MVGAVAQRAEPDNEATWRRALCIVLAGLRADRLAGTTPDGSTACRTLNYATTGIAGTVDVDGEELPC
jgi:hypothetical protein